MGRTSCGTSAPDITAVDAPRHSVADMTFHADDLGTKRIASSDVALTALERGLEVMRTCRDCIKGLKTSGGAADASDTASILLVEIGGFDCVILWRVEGGAPTPVSAARANDRRPSIDELMRLISNPPRLEELGLELEFPCETDLTATAKLGACHTTDPATGLWSWAIAAVTTRSHPPFVLQALNFARPMDHTDRDLLLSFAQLSAALVIQPGGAEFQRRARVWARASAHDSGGGNERWIKATANAPIQDEGDSALDTLTIREREVLAHALTGATYEAMADALFVSSSTVKSHMQSILRKLDVHSRAQLIARFGSLAAAS